MILRCSQSPGLTRSFRLPLFVYIQDPLYVDCSLVRGLAVFFYVSCHPLSHSHSRIQSPILFFSSTDAILLQAVLPPTYGGRRLATLLSCYVLEPIPSLSCARAFHSRIAVVLKHFIYLRKAPYIPLSRVTVLVRTRHCCPPTLHFFRPIIIVR